MKNHIGNRSPRAGLEAFLLVAIAILLGAGIARFSQPALAQGPNPYLEALRGSAWGGEECCGWKFGWKHKSGPFFSARWWHPNGQQMSDDNLVINIFPDTNDVEILRGGGSTAGGCTYRGKIYVGRANGEYWCNGKRAGTWGALITP